MVSNMRVADEVDLHCCRWGSELRSRVPPPWSPKDKHIFADVEDGQFWGSCSFEKLEMRTNALTGSKIQFLTTGGWFE